VAAHRLFAPASRRARRAGVPEVEPPSSRWQVNLRQDLRAAWRGLARQAGVSITIVGALALGLAANATIFALGDALVLRPFRFAGVDRTVLIASAGDDEPFFDRSSVTPGDFADWTERTSGVLSHVAGLEWWNANLSGRDYPEQVAGFRVLRVHVHISAERAADTQVRPPASVEAPRSGEDNGTYERVHDEADAAVRPPARVLPLVERIAVLEPAAGEHGSSHEVRQAPDAPQVSSGGDVVVRTSELARVVRAESERASQRELVGRKGRRIE
jgi:hypothetical protein